MIKIELRCFLLPFVLLALCACSTLSASTAVKAPETVVLYTTEEPIIPDLPDNCCEYIPLEDFQNDLRRRADMVIVAGHGKPPEYASHSYQEVAAAVASFQPELIVMNSCYGASTDILSELTRLGLDAYVVAAPFPIYQPGFTFEPAFFSGTLTEKVMAVHTEPDYPILRWKLNAKDLKRIENEVAALSVKELHQRLRRVQPALVRMPLATELESKSEILVPLPPERFK